MNLKLLEIVAVLDRSGSMATTATDVIGGFNAFVAEQKKRDMEVKATVVLFDDQYDVWQDGVDVNDIPDISAVYVPRGSTALLDAVGRAITTVGQRLCQTDEAQRPGKVVVLIMTDGQENASKEYTFKAIADMIKTQRETYSWEFIFIGAGDDVFSVGEGLGIGSTYAYNTTSKGTRHAYGVMGMCVNNVVQSKAMPPQGDVSDVIGEQEE